ncbi:YybH family protein [Massilia sp. DWR3-1-1]|uniref:YybH family protein n=1 Tax=Massilia sp. DWR3-1-1 TaxID=2804559 RepID=UPI003CF387BB
MRRPLLSLLFAATAFACGAACALEPAQPAYIGKRVTSAADEAAIRQVAAQFQAAIRSKDVKLLSTLVLNSNIPFDAPGSPEMIARVRDKFDVSYDGVRSGGFGSFARFIGESKEPLEEKFYNLKITQDGHVAWLLFDYEFLQGGKTSNHGIEAWQMMKHLDGKWKIASVIWTANYLPE